MKSKKPDSKTYDEAFEMRVNKGILPTIEIHGHTFYVDIRMNKLRPKDDFQSNGIVFSDIEDYFNDEKDLYIIPYDPQKKEVVKIDYETITQIPKELIVVKIPHMQKLDPVGWNRQHDYDLTAGFKKSALQMCFKANSGKWEDIYVPQKIKENSALLKRLTEQTCKEKLKNDNSSSKNRKL